MTNLFSTEVVTTEVFQRKCPFFTPQDNVKFDNMPGLPERVLIRSMHFLERKLIQKGGRKSLNPIVRLASTISYYVDFAWFGIDHQVCVQPLSIQSNGD